MDKNTKILGTGRIGRLLWRFSLPSVMSMLVMLVYNMTDRYFIAESVGADGIAALAVTTPLFFIAMTLGHMCSVGGNTLFSIRLGEKKEAAAARILSNTFAFQIILGLAFVLFGSLFLEPITRLCGGSSITAPLAAEYMGIIMFGMIFEMSGQGLNNFIRSVGRPRRAMFNNVFGAGLNVLLDWLFMMKFGWGMAGAAAATSISMAASFALAFGFFFAKSAPIRLAIRLPDPAVLLLIFKYGIAPFVSHITLAVGAYINNTTLVRHGGDTALSAFGITDMIASFGMMVVFGITHGMQSIAGYNFGARNWERLRKVVRLTLACSTLWLAAFALCGLFFAPGIVGAFSGTGGDPAMPALAAHMLRSRLLVFPFMAIVWITLTYLSSTGQYWKNLFTHTTRIGFTICLMLILPRFWGIEGAVWAYPTADSMSVVLTAAIMWRQMKKINAKTLAKRKAAR